MDIGNALRRIGRQDIALRSILSNTISQLYVGEIEIRSVQIRGKNIIIKTGNPLVNAELELQKGDIKKASLTKLSGLGITLPEDCVFIFR